MKSLNAIPVITSGHVQLVTPSYDMLILILSGLRPAKMSFKKQIKKEFRIKAISSNLCEPWFLLKHYAKRKPSVSFAFGLYDAALVLVGVCSYGRPMSHALVSGAMNGDYEDRFLELNRLVVNDGLPPNTLSYFVSQTLSLLPSPCVVVSYADTAQNHHGYIYQATNWVYTG